jgi:ABC-type multidrug transport system ATPase subunit
VTGISGEVGRSAPEAGETAPFLAITGGLPFRVFRFERESAVAGRAPDADFPLSHVEVSRHHCRFEIEDGTLFVEDLGSRWGTRVNGAALKGRTALSPDDRVQLGSVLLVFGIGEPGPALRSQSEAASAGGSLAMLFRGRETDAIPLGGELVFGREESCDAVLVSPAVSRRHLQVQPAPAGFKLIDLRSRAGSFVNGQRFDEHDLVIGDRLQIGPFYFQFDGLALRRASGTPGARIEAMNVSRKAGRTAVLDNVTVTFEPCHFAGIIGPSGAGKSSLLDAVSGMRAPESGQVLIDGVDVYASGERPAIGFVPQEDIVHRELTVSEALRFGARLRLRAGTPALEIHKLVLQTMDQLGLRERAGTRIAELSGGQRKRVSVGVELLARPPALYLDEPSSGLDPATEFKLMELLRELTDTGCTIVCTTHVLENVYLMDQLAVLSGGRLVFTGTAEETRAHFGVAKLYSLYDQLGTAEPEATTRGEILTRARHAALPHRRSHSGALRILLNRQWAILASDRRNFLLLLGQPLLIAALVAWVTDDPSLALFFSYIATMWFGCSNAAQEIVREMAIYRRERLIGVSRHAYLGSKFLFLGAMTATQGLLFFAVLQIGEIGLAGSLAWQIGALLGSAGAAVGIGAAISALARSVMQAVLLVPVILIPLILFSGYTVPANEMKPAVAAVAEWTPAFAAQSVMDVSFLWRRRIDHQALGDHWTSFRNLNRDRRFRTGDVYQSPGQGFRGLGIQLAWIAAGYLAAAAALRVRERA